MGKKRRRSSKSKTGLTPPCKTGSNMASHNQNNNNNNVSDVITQAHDCLHGSYTAPSTSANVSQSNVNNQTFNCSSNFTQAPPPNLPRPNLQSTPYQVQSKAYLNSLVLCYLCHPLCQMDQMTYQCL